MKKILVLFGGCSPEYAVSLQSAYSVLRHMDRERYRPIPVGITQAGDWFLYTGKWEAILAGTWQERHCLPAAVSPNRRDHGLLVWRRGGMEIIPLDGAFPVLHGKNGEDGTVQGLLELAGIPVVGCGTLASALCMDKVRAHQLVQAAGVEIPRSRVFDREASEQELMDGAASLMISGGADVATVSGLLGHSQVSTTLDIYTHAFDEKKREVSAQMQGRVGV